MIEALSLALFVLMVCELIDWIYPETNLTACGCVRERKRDGSRYRSMERTINCPVCLPKLERGLK
jgi:hypothetical protein